MYCYELTEYVNFEYKQCDLCKSHCIQTQKTFIVISNALESFITEIVIHSKLFNA